MTKDDFIKLYTADPNSDDVMTEINRLYDAETTLTADFAAADAERAKLRTDLDAANKRYRERFLSGNPEPDEDTQKKGKPSFDSLFKDK